MAANKFATKLNRSSNKIVVILVYAVLEWVLIALLLFNSLFYYLIKKFASFFGLKPTCLWCSSVDCLFESGIKDGSYEGLFCEDHTSKISKIGSSQSEDGSKKELSCSCCGKRLESDLPHLVINGLLDVVAKESVRIEEEEDQDNNVSNEEPHILSDVGSFYLQEAAEEDSSRCTSNSLCNENEEDARGVEMDESEDASGNDLRGDQLMEPSCVMVRDDSGAVVAEEEEKEIKHVETEKKDVGEKGSSVSCESDLKLKDIAIGYEEEVLIIGDGTSPEPLNHHLGEKHNEQLRSELESERKAHKELSIELEAERNAAAIAANQTMAMITRLQEEKAAIKMEAVQYQRMMEEQAEYDQEALQLLNELVIKREKEKQELEKELELYKEKALSLRKSGCSLSSCSLNDDSEKLSIDLNCEVREDSEYENKEEPSTGAVLDSVDLVLDRVKNWNMLDGSLEEFEEERLSILHQLKELEETLFSVCEDDQEEQLVFEDVKPIEHFLEEQGQDNEVKDENANLCSAEVNLVEPTTMALAAKKLLPLLEIEDGEAEQKAREVDTNDKVVAVMKEMDHVYGRLQALEADREFLRHCIGSLNKGDKGAGLLEEILQHLRELRNADTCKLMICDE